MGLSYEFGFASYSTSSVELVVTKIEMINEKTMSSKSQFFKVPSQQLNINEI